MADKLVVGCGYLGRRIAALWCAQNHRVFAMTRSTARADEWRARGLQPILCDGVPGTPYSTPAGLVLARSGSIGVRPRQDRCDRTVSGRAFAPGRSAPADLQEFRSSGDTIPNCLGEFREIRESKQRTGIAPYGHPAGTLGATGVERLRPRESGQGSDGGEQGTTD